MKIEEIEKLCEHDQFINRHCDCFPMELAKKLVAVAKAAKKTFESIPMCTDMMHTKTVQMHRKALKEAVIELEKD